MGDELAALAASGATTIVNLLATDAWSHVRREIGLLWRRFRPEQADTTEAALDQTRLEIASADETTALAVTRDWESRLLRLLAADPAARAELSRVIAGLGRLSVGQQRSSVRQNAKASGHSAIIQVGGNAAMGEMKPQPSP